MEKEYEQFKKEYEKLFNESMKYSPNQAGSKIFTERMADLADEYPEYEERLDEELDLDILSGKR